LSFSAATDKKPTFSSGYRSDVLTQVLEFVIERQDTFRSALEMKHGNLLQVQLPTEVEKAWALKLGKETLAPDGLQRQMAVALAYRQAVRFSLGATL